MPRSRMPRGRRLALWSVVAFAVVLVAGATASRWLPGLVRQTAIARIHAVTDRPVSIDGVDLGLWSGRVTVRGLRIDERADAGTTAGTGSSHPGPAFAEIERLDLRVHVPSLLLGRIRLREAVLVNSTVRVVRLADGAFNFSDLIAREGASGPPRDILVERLAVRNGTVSLEDRQLAEPRTWTSERLEIDARNLSTRRGGGTVTATSMTAGARVSLDLRDVRLYPIHLEGTLNTDGLDLTLVQMYLPARSPVVVQRGRVNTSVSLALDATEGLRAHATGRLRDVSLVRPDGETLALVPALDAEIRGLGFRGDGLRVESLRADGTMRVRDPSARSGAPLRASRVRASLDQLTWPVTTPGHVDVETSLPGGGTLAIAGTLQPPPQASQLRLRLADLDLAPWAHLLPIAARVTGLAYADLRIDEPLGAGVPARIQGSVGVTRAGVADGATQRLGAARIEASGLELEWPRRLAIQRVTVTSPRGSVERDRSGKLSVSELFTRRAATPPGATGQHPTAPQGPALAVSVAEIAVRDGALAWRDETVSPPARLTASGIDGAVTGVGWPLRESLGVRADLQPPGGGRLRVAGRVNLDPAGADLRVIARNADLAPYQPYLATPARVKGAADLDLAVSVPSFADRRATARGTAALSRLDVRDAERTIVRLERGTATGIDVAWPERIQMARVALVEPWALAERNESGALTLRPLLTPRPAPPAATGSPATPPRAAEDSPEPAAGDRAPTQGEARAVAISIEHLSIERGGARLVDRAMSPPFAADLRAATVRLEGFSTARARPARFELSGELGSTALLTLRGSVRTPGERPLLVDVDGELRRFAIPRANPYLLEHAGWKTTDGWLSSKIRVRVEGTALSARTDLRMNRLHLVRAAAADEAKGRIGLPLGMLTSLMKDSHGDIALSIPVGGRLDDPRFDFSEAIWGAVRTVSVRAIALPVSWIGRIRFTGDARIQRIDVDPIPFAAGADALTDDARERVARIAAFMEERPEARMGLTAVVTPADAAALRRPALEAAIERTAREARLSRDAAAARLFAQRFPDRPPPATTAAIIAMLLEAEPASAETMAELGKGRIASVQKALKRAGVDAERVPEVARTPREGGGEPQVALELLEPEAPRPRGVRGLLQRIGVPVDGPREGS